MIQRKGRLFFFGQAGSLSYGIVFLAIVFLALPRGNGQGKTAPKITPKLEPIADTKLLMEGLAHANFRGLERNLTTKPTEDQTWVFARGQALLIAETANLLMLRPPKTVGQDTWFARTMDLRAKATRLARTITSKNFEQSRREMIDLGNSCTKCHQSFRVPVVIEPFGEAAPKVE